ncbi:MAG: Protein phosphatase methylesterase 1 [Marteilia pararefringens]
MYDHLIVNSIKKDNASRLPSVIIVGHSMGGCVAIEISRRGKLPNVRAFVTIDCFADLESQHYYLTNSTDASENRLYESVDHAVDEYRKSFNTVDHNMARISIESRLNQTIHGFKFNLSYLDTSKYWHDWFHDLTQKFLSQSCYKIAIISGSRDDNLSRLDKEMTIAHMSGKYQLNPLPGACHNVQEDQPMEVLDIINTFVRRVLPIWK